MHVDFAAHAAAMGCNAERVATIAELEHAFARARRADRTTVIVIATDPHALDRGRGVVGGRGPGGERPGVDQRRPRAALDEAKAAQRVGI